MVCSKRELSKYILYPIILAPLLFDGISYFIVIEVLDKDTFVKPETGSGTEAIVTYWSDEYSLEPIEFTAFIFILYIFPGISDDHEFVNDVISVFVIGDVVS